MLLPSMYPATPARTGSNPLDGEGAGPGEGGVRPGVGCDLRVEAAACWAAWRVPALRKPSAIWAGETELVAPIVLTTDTLRFRMERATQKNSADPAMAASAHRTSRMVRSVSSVMSFLLPLRA